MLILTAILALIIGGTSINLLAKNWDPNVELNGADRVLGHVF